MLIRVVFPRSFFHIFSPVASRVVCIFRPPPPHLLSRSVASLPCVSPNSTTLAKRVIRCKNKIFFQMAFIDDFGLFDPVRKVGSADAIDVRAAAWMARDDVRKALHVDWPKPKHSLFAPWPGPFNPPYPPFDPPYPPL